MKLCSRCKELKPTTEYYKAVERHDGLRSECRSCCTKAHRESYKRNKDSWVKRSHDQNKTARIKSKYGISREEYDSITSNPCTICGAVENIVLDHCHKTGKVRGALCQSCNVGLGGFKDDVVKLENAIRYLKDNT